MALNPVQSLKRVEAQLEKQLGTIQTELDRVRGALQMLRGGKSTGGKIVPAGRKRRTMSAATRKKMAASARKRWAAKKEQ